VVATVDGDGSGRGVDREEAAWLDRPGDRRRHRLNTTTQPGKTSRIAGWKVVLRRRKAAAR
jgi:hypothetical protein